MTRGIALVVALGCIVGGTFSAWASQKAPQCPVCIQKLAYLKNQEKAKKDATELLGQNSKYLAMISAKEASKFLKVKSNLVFILKRLDQIKADTARAEDEFQQKGCVTCFEKDKSRKTAAR